MSKKNTEKKAPAKSIAADIVAKADARKKELEKAAKAKADATSLNASHGLAISKAVEKGIAVANKCFGADDLVAGLSKALTKSVNPNISSDGLGLVFKDGYQPTELEVSEIISAMGGIGKQNAAFDRAVTWVLADAAVEADRFEGGSDRVVAQAISERGVTKHTAQRAYVVAKEIPKSERIKGLTFTHYSEIVNYRKGIKNKKGLEKLMDELREQAKTDEIMPCSELRERLQILAGKKPEDEEEPEKEKKEKGDKPDKFFYISADGDIKFSLGFNARLCKEYGVNGIIINATENTALNDDGVLDFSIKEASNAITVEVEVMKPEPPKPKKAKSAVVPD